MAHTKSQGSTTNGRDSNSKRLGVKAYGGQFVTAGSIIVRQRGNCFHAGLFVGRGNDFTLFAQVEAVADVSYKGDLLFATERARLGVQKDAYSIALAADVVQTKTEAYATLGLTAAVQF